MSILRSKEKTYPFTLEGLAQMKADDRLVNRLNECDPVKTILILGVVIAGASLICSPLSSIVAYKSITEAEMISQVAFKAISTIL